MKCNEFKEKVPDLFDKTIDMQTQALLSEHMKSCPECKAYYEELRETFDMLQPKEGEEIRVKNKSDKLEGKSNFNSSFFTLRWLAPSFASSLWKTAAIFIAAAFLCGLSFAAYHAISLKQNTDTVTEQEPRMLGAFFVPKDCKNPVVKERGDAITAKWTKGTWVQHDHNSFIEEHKDGGGYMFHLNFYGKHRSIVRLDGKELDIHNLPDLPASALKKVEIHRDDNNMVVNLITTPVRVPADVKGNVNPELTILLTGAVPKGAYQPVTIWQSSGIKESYDWHDYIYTSWTGQWENIQRHLNEVVNRKDHHVRINVCKGTPQKHIDRIKSIMKECGVTNYEIVKQ